jgi:hypothetical protein
LRQGGAGLAGSHGSGVGPSGVRSPAQDEQPFSCTSTGFASQMLPSYDSGNPRRLTGVAWAGTGTGECTVTASISASISALDPQGEPHEIAAGSCVGCTGTSVANTGYTCVQDTQNDVNCTGEWLMSYTITFQVPPDHTFDSASPGCTIAGSTMTCTLSGSPVVAPEFGGTGGDQAVRDGQAGEAAVRAQYDIGEKKQVNVNGRNRILDGLNKEAVTEVKNVDYQAYTLQLKDCLAYAKSLKLRFDLYVRGGANPTRLSKPLQAAIDAGDITRKDIP